VLTATLINLGDNSAPIEGSFVNFQVTEGPHAGLSDIVRTDTAGHAIFRYTGTKVGTDKIVVVEELATNGRRVLIAALGDITGLKLAQAGEAELWDEARVTWDGGPDLVIPFFVPPLIESKGGETIYVTESTLNSGNTKAKSSITRYFLSDQPPPFDLTKVRAVGERTVSELAPDSRSQEGPTPIVLPNDLLAGTYYMGACADANDSVVELNEMNNCSYNELLAERAVIAPVRVMTNNPPDCTQAVASQTRLWPPNHKLTRTYLKIA